jgi:hypothetical protein
MDDATDIRRIIDGQLAACWNLSNWHGITVENINDFLVTPRLETFATWDEHRVSLWIVLDECRNEKEDGYLVVYNPDNHEFGLALKPSEGNPGVLLGYHGTFVETMAGM